MTEPRWISREYVIKLHDLSIEKYGGLSGLRDEGLLESALARPHHKFAYEQASLFELAASDSFGLVKNHPFADGNKRIAFMMGILFLELNGLNFSANEDDAIHMTLGLASGETDERTFARWLEENSYRNQMLADR